MYITTFGVHPNPPFNTVQLLVFEVLVLHENIESLPSVDFYELSPRDDEPTGGIELLLVGLTVINKLLRVEVARED